MTNGKEKEFILRQIRKTLQEQDDMKNYFNNITDPDLIDYSIYYIKALEKKYCYYLKKARKFECPINEI